MGPIQPTYLWASVKQATNIKHMKKHKLFNISLPRISHNWLVYFNQIQRHKDKEWQQKQSNLKTANT